MSDSPLSVTIKGSGRDKKDEPWIVFYGSIDTIKSDIIRVFGFPENHSELTLHELTVNARQVMHGVLTVASGLGGTVIPPSEAQAASNPAPAAAPAGNAWAQASSPAPAEPQGDPNAYILGQIEAQTTVEDLKRLWAENQAMFADPAVMAAWKAKGKALS